MLLVPFFSPKLAHSYSALPASRAQRLSHSTVRHGGSCAAPFFLFPVFPKESGA